MKTKWNKSLIKEYNESYKKQIEILKKLLSTKLNKIVLVKNYDTLDVVMEGRIVKITPFYFRVAAKEHSDITIDFYYSELPLHEPIDLDDGSIYVL